MTDEHEVQVSNYISGYGEKLSRTTRIATDQLKETFTVQWQ